MESEKAILKAIDNINVVKLYDSFIDNDHHYLVLEYCDSGDLENYVEKKYPNHCLSEAEALGFFKQLLNGFKALHELKVMHRDFKLANVLIHKGVLKIGDFGFCKQAEFAATGLGTGYYMAPEILKLRKGQRYTNKVDIWSMGISLYELLYGVYPFSGKDKEELLKNIEKNHINFHEKGIKINDKFKSLIQSMLIVNPMKRIDW